MDKYAFLSLGLIVIFTFSSLCLDIFSPPSEDFTGLWLFVHNSSSTDVGFFFEDEDMDWGMKTNDTYEVDKGKTQRFSYSYASGNYGFYIKDDRENELQFSIYFDGTTLLIDVDIYDDEITWNIRK